MRCELWVDFAPGDRREIEDENLETVEPELRLLSENPELKREHEIWTANRSKFNADLREPGSEAQAEKWQKLYHRGVRPGGVPSGIDDHRTRLKLKPFARPGAG